MAIILSQIIDRLQQKGYSISQLDVTASNLKFLIELANGQISTFEDLIDDITCTKYTYYPVVEEALAMAEKINRFDEIAVILIMSNKFDNSRIEKCRKILALIK